MRMLSDKPLTREEIFESLEEEPAPFTSMNETDLIVSFAVIDQVWDSKAQILKVVGYDNENQTVTFRAAGSTIPENAKRSRVIISQSYRQIEFRKV